MAAQSDQNPTVFIVDDDAAIRFAMQALMDSVNLEHEIFESGDDFLEKVGEQRQMKLELNGWRGSTKALELKDLSMAFGDDLRTDQKIDFPLLDPADQIGSGLRPADRIAGHDFRAGLGKQRRHFFGEPLDPRAARHQRLGFAALRACLGNRDIVPTMVTGNAAG